MSSLQRTYSSIENYMKKLIGLLLVTLVTFSQVLFAQQSIAPISGNWKIVYGKDRYGDEDKSNPMLACASKYGGVVFYISPTKGIILYFPDTKFVPFNYDNNTLYIKTQNHEEIKIDLTLLDKGLFHVPTQDDNFTLLDILDNGHFKVALEMSDIVAGTKTLNAEVEKETLGVVNAMEHYFMDIPDFQDAWQIYGD